MYFFTADFHWDHAKIIEYSNRPFSSVEEMNEELIKRHNEVVRKGDIVIYAGDLTWLKNRKIIQERLISRLKGDLIFLRGSHDRWLSGANQIWEKMVDGHYIVVCHYCMRTWARSHYNSWHLFGHSHGRLPPIGKSHDIGVDTHNFYPYSMDEVIEIMSNRPDNPNLIRRN